MAYTLGEAAKATGISKASISRAINSGRISAIKTESGSFSIEPVELHRVYPPKSSAPVSGVPSETVRSEEHTSELQSLMRISYAVFCLKKKTINNRQNITQSTQKQT